MIGKAIVVDSGFAFGPEVARALDVTLGGLSVYRALGLGAVSDQDIATLLRSIAHPAGA